MDRIEEIKERFNRWKNSTAMDPEELYEAVADNATDDIEYLLSKLEIAEKALERVSLDSTFPEDCQGIANEALQQIRE